MAPAEHLPAGNATVDLITLSSVFHWLDRRAFCAEARRLLRPQGWLIVYDNYFAAQMHDTPAFHTWWREQYPRKNRPFSAPQLSLYSLTPIAIKGNHVFWLHFSWCLPLHATS